MMHHFYTIDLRIDLDKLIQYYSELDEIDSNDPTTIDQTSDDAYPYYDQIYFALYSLFHTRARFILREILRARFILPAVQQIFTPVPPRRHIQRHLAEIDQPYNISLDDAYIKVHRLEEFPDPLGPVGDPTTKHIRPPPTPTSGLKPSRFSEPCFALFMLRRDELNTELEEDFEESQYGSSADSDGRKPKYQLIKEKDDEIMGRGQGGEKQDWGIDWEGYDVCEEDETLLKIEVDITSDEYKESVKKKKNERTLFIKQIYEQKVYSQHRLLHPIPVPPFITRAAGIPGT
ncbi:MAG: hypothetical protein EZS28_032627 [Streblomastix strix]|uniref:Uncharacterized protein n=1 Tax=Streblomastix strix TaxID=222440 RepID=A0A5J4UPZ0_9EUKA|nr:MAG: hypothetical protein EZS28_032627 [Streblomastix strix]